MRQIGTAIFLIDARGPIDISDVSRPFVSRGRPELRGERQGCCATAGSSESRYLAVCDADGAFGAALNVWYQ
jgi:hypothetical protein